MGQQTCCFPGDVVFSVFSPDTTAQKAYQHAAIYIEEETNISGTSDQISVVEAVDEEPYVREYEWPTEQYQVQLVGRKESIDRNNKVRSKIVNTARMLAKRAGELINMQVGKRNLNYSFTQYKNIKLNPNIVSKTDVLLVTCAGLVEYCYEDAQQDLVKDGKLCSQIHNSRADCIENFLPLVEHPNPRKKDVLVHRLFPGYLAEAFSDESYPLDFTKKQADGKNWQDFQYYRCEMGSHK